MTEYVHLVGSEPVTRAAHSMHEAALAMERTTMNLAATLLQHERFLEAWLERLENVITRAAHTPTAGLGPSDDTG